MIVIVQGQDFEKGWLESLYLSDRPPTRTCPVTQ